MDNTNINPLIDVRDIKIEIKTEPDVTQEPETSCMDVQVEIKQEVVEYEVPVEFESPSLETAQPSETPKPKKRTNSRKQSVPKKAKLKRKLGYAINKPEEIEPKTNKLDNEVDNDNLYVYCKICNQKCSNERTLDTHMKVHDISRRFPCEICGFRFKYKTELDKHFLKHSDLKYECDMCEYQSKYKCGLSRHKVRIHNEIQIPEEKNDNQISNSEEKEKTESLLHVCHICKYKCFVKETFMRHLKLHDERRKHICNICSYRFGTKNDLGRHMTKHSDQKHSCKVCYREFKQEHTLNKHMAEHEGKKYCCSVCGHVCNSKTLLSMHISGRHSNAYQCAVCSKKFRHSGNYNKHMGMHLREGCKL